MVLSSQHAAAQGPSRLHLPHGTTPALDSALWVLAILLAALLDNSGAIPEDLQSAVWSSALIVCALQIMVYAAFLRGRARYATEDEFAQLLVTDLVMTAILAVTASAFPQLVVPISVAIVAGAFAISLHLGARWGFRRLIELRSRPRSGRARRTIVLGAGYGGEQAIRLMLEDGKSSFLPVGILDDDPTKRHLRISGVRVLGTWEMLESVAADTHADLVLLAVPSASAATVESVVSRARDLGLDIRVMPSTTELLGRQPAHGSNSASPGDALAHSTQVFRPLRMEDLLGRRAIDTDVDAIGDFLTGKRVLVTGAGGSIGSQLCREIARYSPERLVMVDRDESALHAVELSLTGEARLDDPNLILGDLRTPGLINALFEECEPQVVFHAAALKHVGLTERFPEEAFLTNVVATADLLDAAARHGVERFVNISTDKAANPASVLGYSKRVAERLTATSGSALDESHRFISVRFGNVLGSRGSALVTFATQLERGLPLTITHPKMERFFMSVDEACQLVLQAAVLGSSGDALVLDMGEPHNIEAIARRFAALMGYPDPRVVYTHVGEGEKMSEVLFSSQEEQQSTAHALISRVAVPALTADEAGQIQDLRSQVRWGQRGALVTTCMQTLSSGSEAAA